MITLAVTLVAAAVPALAPLAAAPDSAPPAPAADTGAPRWRAALTGGFESFASQRTPWSAWDARIERRDGRGTLAAEAVLARRFSLTDGGGAVDAYRVLWSRAYGNVRVVVAPGARVIPRLDASAELYQGVGDGWELSAGYRRLSYAGGGVDVWALSAAKYAGDWYLRARGTLVPTAGTVGGALGLLVRRYLGTSDDLVDVSASAGKDVVTLGPALLEVRTTTEAALRVQRFVTARWGLSATATYAGEQGIPTRIGMTVGLMRKL